MLRTSLLIILNDTWPMLVICTVIMVTIRLTYIFKNKLEFAFYKEVLYLGFAIYIMCLYYVVTFQDVNWSTSNFIPFKEMFRHDFGTDLFMKNVLGNMIMFFPYGFFTAYFLKLKKPISILLLSIITSLTIEIIQLKIGRVFDVDDIILNIFGGMLGFCLAYLLEQLKEYLPKFLKNSILYNILVILVLVIIVLYLTNIIKVW